MKRAQHQFFSVSNVDVDNLPGLLGEVSGMLLLALLIHESRA